MVNHHVCPQIWWLTPMFDTDSMDGWCVDDFQTHPYSAPIFNGDQIISVMGYTHIR